MNKKGQVSEAYNIYYANQPRGSVRSGWIGRQPANQHRFERFSIKAELKKRGYESF